jgi:hypothetical protein
MSLAGLLIQLLGYGARELLLGYLVLVRALELGLLLRLLLALTPVMMHHVREVLALGPQLVQLILCLLKIALTILLQLLLLVIQKLGLVSLVLLTDLVVELVEVLVLL